MWAVAIWNKRHKALHKHEATQFQGEVPANAALRVFGLLGIAGCLLAMVAASLSRMGFIASLSAIATVGLAWVLLLKPFRCCRSGEMGVASLPRFCP